MNLGQINTASEDGRRLMAALVMLTQAPEVNTQSGDINGKLTHPDDMLAHVEALAIKMYPEHNSIPINQPVSFERAIAQTINKYSRENDSNTPDFILASICTHALFSFNEATKNREKWYGKALSIV